jgi:hypothetical protein
MQTKQLVGLGVWLAGVCVASLALETQARACGGTFCDGGGGGGPVPDPAPPPAAMRVEQTGETVIFAWGDGFVEAHIQISYDGNDATEFAWIVPVLKVPDVEVGSARLFQTALDSTRPLYGHAVDQSCSTDGDTEDDNDPSVGFIQDPDGGGGSPSPPPPPQVLVQDVVGAFDYVVLDGDSSASIIEWLGNNGYAGADGASVILEEYVNEGFVFIAFKLRHIAGVEDLHPIVLRYAGDEPCVPLRLTRVAAVDDMPIRVLAFADERAMPVSWRHVLLNRARLDWVGAGANYEELVTKAIDEPGSDGRGFITEFAGSSSIVDRTILANPAVEPDVFANIAVTDVYEALRTMDLASCVEGACNWGHELVPSLLHEYVPVPEGMTDGEFYGCLSCFVDLIDVEGWDPTAFADAFEERIIAPLEHADALLDRWPKLTRLYTRVSPHEMISDPTFALAPDADPVPFELYAQTQGVCCSTVRVPGGRLIELDDDATWPEWSAEMPWAERIEELMPGGGPASTLVNNSALIDALVLERAETVGCNALPPSSSSNGDDDDASSGDAPSAAPDEARGCACATTRENDLSLVGLLMALPIARRRRR